MILNFSIKNYRSFKELNSLSLETAEESSPKPLRFAAIYGPNASGKTSLLKALEYMRFAMQNIDAVNKLTLNHVLLQPFLLNAQSSSEPSFFELTLLDETTSSRYQYGFEVTKERIVSEWLVETAKRETNLSPRELYTRTEKGINFHSSISKDIKQFKNNIPETILALPFLANNNYDIARRVTNLVVSKLVLFDSSNVETIRGIAYQRYLVDSQLRADVLKLIKSFDVDIQGISIEQIPISADDSANLDAILQQLPFFQGNLQGLMKTSVSTRHNVYDAAGKVKSSATFDLNNHESLGTQKLIPFIIMALDAMRDGYTLVIDEFGSSFHPFITEALVRLFLTNKHSAQLVVLTHETHLLGKSLDLGADQIWFVEKSCREESTLVAVTEYKPRTDARVDKQYLEGRFGAVPTVLDTKQ